MSTPEIVLGASLLTLFLNRQIVTGFGTIFIAHVMFIVSYVVVTVKARLIDFDRHLEEAAMEPVPECQSPLFLHVDADDRNQVRLYFSAPPEAPTTRGFASILAQGLDKQSADDILAVPDDFYTDLGLAALISPLRLRGMSAMLARVKRHLH